MTGKVSDRKLAFRQVLTEIMKQLRTAEGAKNEKILRRKLIVKNG